MGIPLRAISGSLALIGASFIVVSLVRSHLIGPATIEWTTEVCRGDEQARCRQHRFFVGCGSITEWAQQQCREFSIVDINYAAGGRCGYVVASVTCRASLR
jgi:hypothetical protein